MTHKLTADFLGNVWLEDKAIPLAALHSVVIPALCMGSIPHGIELRSVGPDASWVMLVRETNTFFAGLLVDQGPVEDGPVFTHVFNLTNQEVRIRKGEVISRLVRVPGAIWKL